MTPELERMTRSHRPCAKLECETCAQSRADLAKLEADARALWAVRVLDAWQKTETPAHETWYTVHTVNGSLNWFRCNLFIQDLKSPPIVQMFDGTTPDAARIAAAEALVAADPSLDPR